MPKVTTLDIDRYEDNAAVQDFLVAWQKRHLAQGDEGHDSVEGMIELLQETLPAQKPAWSPQEEALHRAAQSFIATAAASLGRAAVLHERTRRYTSLPLGSEHQLWMLVRVLYHEFGLGTENDVTKLVDQLRAETQNPWSE